MDIMQKINDIGIAQIIGAIAIIALIVVGVRGSSRKRDEE